MIESIHFKNFKALRDTTLPLGPLTVLVGANGTGKSTVLQAMELSRGVADGTNVNDSSLRPALTFGPSPPPQRAIWVYQWHAEQGRPIMTVTWEAEVRSARWSELPAGEQGKALRERLARKLTGFRVYNLDADRVAEPVKLKREMKLEKSGAGLAGVLDRMRDNNPEKWEAVNRELQRWLPEYDRVLFDTPKDGHRAIKLRAAQGAYSIGAQDLSHGTLLALALLTLAYLPDPPPIIGLEEPDRGLHPRLLTDVRDAIFRLAYPESSGEKREPVQVIATTHSPYMLDLFKDHPEDIVIAGKTTDNVVFQRLSEMPDIEEILSGESLGEIWFSGVLGGVPAEK